MDKFLSFCLLCLLLSGCVGSKFVSDEDTTMHEFPSLHSVPERKNTPLRTPTKAQKEELTELQQQQLEENKRLREQFLSPAHTKAIKEESD